MKCPACFNSLTQRSAGGMMVDVCDGGCGGIWFDAFELQKVDELDEAAGESLLNITRDQDVLVDSTRKRDCPRCEGMKLKRHFFSARKAFEVDQCPNCGGYWLDAGELGKIREERAASAATAKGDRNISMEVIRYLYRLKTEGRTEA